MIIDFVSLILGALLVAGIGSGLVVRDAMRSSDHYRGVRKMH